MPIETNCVADSFCKNLKLRSVRTDSCDRAEHRFLSLACVAWHANRHVELIVRTKSNELPAVPRFLWILVVHHNRFWRIAQVLFDFRKAEDSADFRYVKVTLINGDSIRRIQSMRDCEDFVGFPIFVLIDNRVNVALIPRAHEYGSVWAERH